LRTIKKKDYYESKRHNFTILTIICCFFIPIFELSSNKSNNFIPSYNLQNQDGNLKENAILWKYGQGLVGTGPTMPPKLIYLEQNGEPYVVVGMDGSLALLSMNGDLEMSYITFGEVIDFDLIDDISGDLSKDIIINVYDQQHPNVIAVSSKDGNELWTFQPQVERIDQDTFNVDYYTPYTWDVQTINDINNDNISEVAISAWYKIYVLNGRTGDVLWMNTNDFTNDIWKIKYLDKMVIGGSENGELIALNEKNGLKVWSYTIPPFKMKVKNDFAQIDVPNSVDDIVVINDIDNDNVADLLVASDNGKVLLISGNSGKLLDSLRFFSFTNLILDISNPNFADYNSEDISSPYTSLRRLFRASGATFIPIPDVNEDGKDDFLIVGTELDYNWNYLKDRPINGTVFSINNGNLELIQQFTYEWFYFLSSSYPLILKVDSVLKFYMYVFQLRNQTPEESAGVYAFNIKKQDFVLDNTNFSNPAFAYRDRDIDPTYGKDTTSFYLTNIGDVNNNGGDDIFAISKYGKYLLIDCKTNSVVWVRSITPGESEMTQIQDINGDGARDFLYKKLKDFNPQWSSKTVTNGLITEFLTIDGQNGDEIWKFSIPQPDYYEGVRDIKEVGDLTNDGIDDYAAWMIPLSLPNDTKIIIRNLSGMDYLNINDNEQEEVLYRVLLSNYTRFIAIDGSNGEAFWNRPLPDFMYNFYRDYENMGTYLNPVNLSSCGDAYYLRRNEPIPASWINQSDEILWESEWLPSTLTHANSIGIEYGEHIAGGVLDVRDDTGNYSVKALNNAGTNYWCTSLNFSFPINFSNKERLGLLEYPLSQLERFAALKMQMSILVNDSSDSNWYNFTYEIYEESTGKWVKCSWNGTNYWNLQYDDLYGNFRNSTNGGYRSNSDGFNFTTTFQRDDMYVITRGTYNYENGVYFDYENETTLSRFIDSNRNLNIRINITNSNHAFETSIQYFGIGGFYWGLFGNQYDRFYIYNYNLSSEPYFTDINLLDLEIQQCEVIEGTGDEFPDVLMLIGRDNSNNTYNTRFMLFDIKHQKSYIKWSRTHFDIPYQDISLLSLNSSFNYWIVRGMFDTGTNYYSAIKLMQNPRWEDPLSYFDKYNETKTYIDYQWSIDSGEYVILGKTNITEDGSRLGVVLGDYNGSDKHIKIIDIATKTTISKISADHLLSNGGVTEERGVNTGYKLLLSYDDFNGDNYLDHVGCYLKTYSNQFGEYQTSEIRIYSGASGEDNYDILTKYSPPVSESWKESPYKMDIEKGIDLPFASIGDITNDGISEGIIGVQTSIHNIYNSYIPFKGANISFYDLFSSSESQMDELTPQKWILEPFHFIMEGWGIPSARIDFFDFIRNIGDFSGDGKDDMLVKRYIYTKMLYSIYMDYYSYSDEKVVEILDPINQKILYRFNLDFDSFMPLKDFNGDGRREWLISYGGTYTCFNSKFQVRFTNLEEGQIMHSNEFDIQWDTGSNYNYFRVYINGNSYKPTKTTDLSVSLGGGAKKIDVFMYSLDGSVIAIDTVNIIVPENYLVLILTLIISAALAGIFVAYHRLSKRKREALVITIELLNEEKNVG